jgi:hypothetical protein
MDGLERIVAREQQTKRDCRDGGRDKPEDNVVHWAERATAGAQQALKPDHSAKAGDKGGRQQPGKQGPRSAPKSENQRKANDERSAKSDKTPNQRVHRAEHRSWARDGNCHDESADDDPHERCGSKREC